MTQLHSNISTEQADAQDATMDLVVGYVLLGGVLVSALLITAGLLWHWLRTGEFGVHYTISKMNLFEFVVADVRQITSAAIRPRALVSLGIATLMLTPYARVVASLAMFAFMEHNWKYSAITGFVLIVLTYSLFLR